jgi:hypothetical protein
MPRTKDKFLPNGTYVSFITVNGNDLLFKDSEDIRQFKYTIKKYLKDISKQLIFKLNTKQCEFRFTLHKEKVIRLLPIGLSRKNKLKIDFNKRMSLDKFNYKILKRLTNLLHSYVKYYNRKYKRNGCLFLRSIERIFITNLTQIKKPFKIIEDLMSGLSFLTNSISEVFIKSD